MIAIQEPHGYIREVGALGASKATNWWVQVLRVMRNKEHISADGNTAVVGGIADNSNAGAAWVYTRRVVPGASRATNW